MALWYARTKAGDRQDQCLEQHDLHRDRKPRFDPSGSVRVIRLTDDGLFAKRCELTDVLYAVRNPPRPVLVVWYIHGWKHNAQPADGDFKAFENLVTRLSEQQDELPDSEQRHVVGVFVGWDGGRGPRGPLQNATFYNRKRAADRISQSAVLTKIIAAAKYARKQRGTPKDMTVMIGHSFGARILYSATSQVLIDQVQRLHPGERAWDHGVISGPADLILLLNPAFEASAYAAIDSLRRLGKEWEGFDKDQPPLLVAIATENDWATRRAFPIAKVLGGARKDYQRQTICNHDRFVTHSLRRVSPSDQRTSHSSWWFDGYLGSGLLLQREALDNPQEYATRLSSHAPLQM